MPSTSRAASLFASRCNAAPLLPVKLRLVFEVDSVQEIRDGAAVLRFLPDRLKSDADASASRALAALETKGVPVTDELRATYQQSHFLHAAMRDPEKPAEPFFDGADEVRAMLVPSERLRLLGAYQGWVEKEFPSEWTSERFKEAMADAESFSVRALLTKYGYDTTRLCVIFSAATRATFPTK